MNTHSNLLPPCTETPCSTPARFTLMAPLAALLLGVVVEHVCLDGAARQAADSPPPPRCLLLVEGREEPVQDLQVGNVEEHRRKRSSTYAPIVVSKRKYMREEQTPLKLLTLRYKLWNLKNH